jgi:regulator of protease activity HflC (stomatin/prohibitin superfamily)
MTTFLVLSAIWAALDFGGYFLAGLAGLDVLNFARILFLPVLFLIYVLCGIKIIDQWERSAILKLGRLTRIAGPGMVWVEPLLSRVANTVSVQDLVVKMGVDSVQTHDNIPISFTLALTMRVTDVSAYTLNVQDGWSAAQQRALTSVTECVANSELDDILHKRSELSESVLTLASKRVANWGIAIDAVEIKDLKISDSSIEEAIAMKARAKKEGEAELVRADMQHSIAERLANAANAYTEDAWKLKGLETLLELFRSASNNTVLIPTDLIDAVAKVASKK